MDKISIEQRVFLLERSVSDINKKLSARGLLIPNRRVSVQSSAPRPTAPLRSKRPTASKRRKNKNKKNKKNKKEIKIYYNIYGICDQYLHDYIKKHQQQ